VSAKPNLKPTLQALLDRDRQELDDHPTPEELIDYHDGKLAAADEEKLRDHLALCHDCADLLLDLVSFASFTPPDQTPALADSEVETAWQKFQPRLAERGEIKALPTVVNLQERREAEKRADLDVAVWRRKLRTAYAIAATLFVGVVGLSIWGSSLSQKISQLLQPQQNIQLELYTDGEVTRGEPDKAPVVPNGASNFSLNIHLNPDWSFDHYEVEIRTGSAGQTVTIRNLVDQDGICSINFPSRDNYPSGLYQVDLYGVGSGRRERVRQYRFQIASR
jgi:hypothetical protein